MNLGNIKSFLAELPIRTMNGHEKFLAVSVFCSSGQSEQEIRTEHVNSNWKRSILRVDNHPTFYSRAQEKGWINPVPSRHGAFVITAEGVEHLTNLIRKTAINMGEIKQTGTLIIVNKKGTHSFDKLIRQVFSAAQKEVFVADSYVDETIFDNLLDSIPKSSVIKLLFMKDSPKFEARSKRFKDQYQRFYAKKYKDLHDRFIIVDNIGFIIGPSLKDAASNSPALVVQLGNKETNLLKSFFEDLWKISK